MYKYIIGIISIIGVFGAGYFFVNNLIKQNQQLSKSIAQLEFKLKVQDNTIHQAEDAIKEWSNVHKNLQIKFQQLEAHQFEATESLRDLHEIFSKHDFKSLVEAKPGLLETRINRGSERSRRLFICATNPRNKSCNPGNKATPKNG